MKIRKIVAKIADSLEKYPEKWEFNKGFLIAGLRYNKNDISLEKGLTNFQPNVYLNYTYLPLNDKERLLLTPIFEKRLKPVYEKFLIKEREKRNKELNDNIKLALSSLTKQG